jgi:hypothetical protein
VLWFRARHNITEPLVFLMDSRLYWRKMDPRPLDWGWYLQFNSSRATPVPGAFASEVRVDAAREL